MIRYLPILPRLVPALLLACIGARGMTAQVNTEAMRHDNAAAGLQQRVNVDVCYQEGNNNSLALGAGYRADLRVDPIYTFLILDYDRGSGNKELYQNAGFAHLRVVWSLDSIVHPEIFAQKQFDDFILLHDRMLGGGGVRLCLVNHRDSAWSATLQLGIGAMYEYERIAATPDTTTRLIRSTNYIGGSLTLGPTLRIGGTAYYQVAPAATRDFRILAEGEIAVSVSPLLAFTTSVKYRFDNEPPVGVVRHDLKIVNGLALTF